MDTTKNEQSELKYNCGTDCALVNVNTGRLLYLSQDLSFGSNSFRMNLEHIYGSFGLPAGFSAKCGKNWKLNIQRYVWNDLTSGDILYMDELGRVHAFRSFRPEDESYQHYYDTSGLGLILEIDPEENPAGYLIYEQGGNSMFFNSFGALTKMTYYSDSARQNPLSKHLIYDDEHQLTEIYDERHKFGQPAASRRIKFEYKAGLLVKATLLDRSKVKETVCYGYDEAENLVRIQAVRGESTRDLALFSYGAKSQMTMSASGENRSAIKFEYDSDGRIKKVQSGSVNFSKQSIIKGAICLGETMCGEFYTGEQRYSYQYQLLTESFQELTHNDFVYHDNLKQTKVTNDKNVTLAYDYDAFGTVYSILEQTQLSIGTGETRLHQASIFPQIKGTPRSGVLGWDEINTWMPQDSAISNESFNGSKVLCLPRGSSFSRAVYKLNWKDMDANSLLYTRVKRSFVLSGWVKVGGNIPPSSTLELRAEISYLGESPKIFRAKFNKSLIDWQFVSVNVVVEKTTALDLIGTDNVQSIVYIDSTGISSPVYFADLRFSEGANPEPHLVSGESDVRTSEITAIHCTTDDNTARTIQLDGENEWSMSDIQQTLRNQAFGTPYLLLYNNGKNAVSCTGTLTLSGVFGSMNVSAGSSFCFDSFFHEKIPTQRIAFRNIDFLHDGKVCKIVEEEVKLFKQSAGESGIKRYDINGKLLYEQDSYGVYTKYHYDDFGDPTGAETGNINAPNARILRRDIEYTENAEHVQSIWDSGNSSNDSDRNEFEYFDPFSRLKKSVDRAGLELSQEYDGFESRLLAIAAKQNGNLLQKVDYGFDVCGQLAKITCGNGLTYEIGYDRFGRINSFDVGIYEIYGKTFESTASGRIERSYFASDPYTLIERYDKYGRQTSCSYSTTNVNNYFCDAQAGTIAQNSSHADFSGVNFSDAPNTSLSKLRKNVDEFSGVTCTYRYDRDDEMTGYTIDGLNGVSATIKSIPSDSGAEEYVTSMFNDEIYAVKRVDNELNVNARISEIKIANLTVFFEYDYLGRIKKQMIRNYNYTQRNETEYEYLDLPGNLTSFLVKKIKKTGIDRGATENYDFTYDSRGNVTGVKRTRNYQVSNGRNLMNIYLDGTEYVSNWSYVYDALNRLTRENNQEQNQTILLTYGDNGNIFSRKVFPYTIYNPTVSPSKNINFTYSESDPDRLTKISKPGSQDQFILYDLCGNPTHYKTPENGARNMTWTRGRLLSQYGTSSYKYNLQGGRTQKKFVRDGTLVTVDYILDGNRIVGERETGLAENYGRVYLQDMMILEYGNNKIYMRLEKDHLGNVVKLWNCGVYGDELFDLEAEYTYDAFGKCTIVCDQRGLGALNPFRWKGYYMDEESGFYYIGGRYYDPSTGRYISAEHPVELIASAKDPVGLNRYVFCGGNPLGVEAYTVGMMPELDLNPERADKTWWERQPWWVKMAIGVAVIAVLAICTYFCPVSCMMKSILAGALKGAIVSGAIYAASGLVMGAMSGAIVALGGDPGGEGLDAFLAEVVNGGLEGSADGFLSGVAIGAIIGAVTGALNCANCFAAGTPVKTKEGDKKIEDIEVGDEVLAFDESTGKQAFKKVVRLFRNSTQVTHKLIFDESNEPIICTPEHPFYILNAGGDTSIVRFEGRAESNFAGQWVQAKYLKVGDKVLLSDGKTAILTKTELEHLSESITTYNFEVQDFHTYYVGRHGILIHNVCLGSEYYRGGSDFSAKPGDVKYTQDGLVKTTHGVSVNSNPAAIAKHGIPHKVIDLPDGLSIIQRGVNATHYEIVASYEMTFTQYQNLLSKIVAIPIG